MKTSRSIAVLGVLMAFLAATPVDARPRPDGAANDSDTIYVASLGKLYTPGGQRGIFRSTDGGGYPLCRHR